MRRVSYSSRYKDAFLASRKRIIAYAIANHPLVLAIANHPLVLAIANHPLVLAIVWAWDVVLLCCGLGLRL
jgi:hypothetical protein